MRRIAICLTVVLCLVLLVSCFNNEPASKRKYKLTVVDNYDLLVGTLEEYYEEGTEVKVYVRFLSGPLAGINVNGIGSVVEDVKFDNEVGCEYYTFIMPSQDSVLYLTLNEKTGYGPIDCPKGYHSWDEGMLIDEGKNKIFHCKNCDKTKTVAANSLVLEYYYLPYYSETDPYSIVLYQGDACEIDFIDGDKRDYYQHYYIENGKLYIDIDTAPKFHVFYITENALIFDPVESTANLWDTMASRGPVVYFKSGVSMDEKLSVITWVGRDLDAKPTIEKIYGPYKIGNRYNDDTDDMYAFVAKGVNANDTWSDKILGTNYTFAYTEGREMLVYIRGMLLTLNEAFDRELITLEILEELYKEYRDCSVGHAYDDGVIAKNEEGEDVILYTCTSCGATETVELPEDFAFSLSWGFDGKYDSISGHLENGYNNELGVKCETTLVLEREELMNIYRIFYNGGLFEIKDSFYASDNVVVPSYDIKISYTINGEKVAFSIYGASYLSYSEWKIHSELAFAYNRVINEFIKSSEEYKALPPNTNIYY